jgi:hypothetical protein
VLSKVIEDCEKVQHEKKLSRIRQKVYRDRLEGSDASRNDNVTHNVTQQRRGEESRGEKIRSIGVSAKPPKGQLSDDDFIKALQDNPAYKGIDIRKELSKMDAWFLTPKGRGRVKTRAFVLNWINKCDAKMGGAHESGEDRIKRIAAAARQREQGVSSNS